MAQLESDFCVVGAGYAGLTAAHRLHQAGQSVTVLEAAPRIGGRTWSAHMSDGTLFEIGGQWVGDHEAQPDVRRLMDELGVEVYGQWDQGKTIFVDYSGKVHEYDAHDANPLKSLPPISMAPNWIWARRFSAWKRCPRSLIPRRHGTTPGSRSRSVWDLAPRARPTR
jgi:monoamine oxidase